MGSDRAINLDGPLVPPEAPSYVTADEADAYVKAKVTADVSQMTAAIYVAAASLSTLSNLELEAALAKVTAAIEKLGLTTEAAALAVATHQQALAAPVAPVPWDEGPIDYPWASVADGFKCAQAQVGFFAGQIEGVWDGTDDAPSHYWRLSNDPQQTGVDLASGSDYSTVTTFGTSAGETLSGKTVTLTGVPTGPSGVTTRRVYRQDGPAGSYKLISEIEESPHNLAALAAEARAARRRASRLQRDFLRKMFSRKKDDDPQKGSR